MGVLDVISARRELAGPVVRGRTEDGQHDAWRQAQRRARGKYTRNLSAVEPRRSLKARRKHR